MATTQERAVLEGVLEQPVQQQQSYSNDLLLMKMENESIMAACRARPRNYADIKRDLEEQLSEFPAMAETSIYAKPVGKDPQTGQQKVARGLSIRSAEILAEAYGFCRVRSDVTRVDQDTVKVEATFTDYQRCRIWQDAGLLSQTYKSRHGGMVRTADDRFFGLTVKAEVSRRIREVILRSVNQGLKAWFQDQCEKVLTDLLTEDKVQAILDKFATKQVSQDQLERFLGKPRAEGWLTDDRKRLLGAWNALEEGEATKEELFGGAAAPLADQGKIEKALAKPQLVPLSFTEVLRTCKTITAVHERAAEIRGTLPDASRNDELTAAVATAVDAIRDKRSTNKAQKELV
jgi:hypothetical protein